MLEEISDRLCMLPPKADFWSLRVVHERNELIEVVRGVVQPVRTTDDTGAMITVRKDAGEAYAATSDLTPDGLARAAEQALAWARLVGPCSLINSRDLPRPSGSGEYETLRRTPWASVPLSEKLDGLRIQCERLKCDDRIVDWSAALYHSEVDSLLVNSVGGRFRQRSHYILPSMSATAHDGVETQTRTFGGNAWARQQGLEVLQDTGFLDAAPKIAGEALELLSAENCPSGSMDLLLAPDQVVIQVHESIGHPLELDRLLGDERNYAGTSFVEPEMFGHYRYGSELLNVVFDPSRPEQLASYAFDDEGTPAQLEYLIKEGILIRPLGGSTSQARTHLAGVACARADGWSRPPIDRMANLNLVPGSSSFDEMVKSVERGLYMETNCSWSIDDARNKFQFGCELGRLIVDGRLAGLVKRPGYRGISAVFWRNLKAVGDANTFQVFGTPFCGKGEPNQLMRVGHAAPACLFSQVEVVGAVDEGLQKGHW